MRNCIQSCLSTSLLFFPMMCYSHAAVIMSGDGNCLRVYFLLPRIIQNKWCLHLSKLRGKWYSKSHIFLTVTFSFLISDSFPSLVVKGHMLDDYVRTDGVWILAQNKQFYQTNNEKECAEKCEAERNFTCR